MKKTLLLLFILIQFFGCKSKNEQVTNISTNIQENRYGIWSIEYYHDEFNEKTQVNYIKAISSGTFGKISDPKSQLVVNLIIDKEDIKIKLLEFAKDYPIKGYSNVVLKIKTPDEKILILNGLKTTPGDISIQKNDIPTILGILKSAKQLKFIVTIDKYGFMYEYLFTIDNNSDFNKAYDRLWSK